MMRSFFSRVADYLHGLTPTGALMRSLADGELAVNWQAFEQQQMMSEARSAIQRYGYGRFRDALDAAAGEPE
jgi:hypothetical protein